MKRRSAPKPPLRIAATCPRICQAQIGGVGGDGYNGWRPLGSSRPRAFLVMAADALARVRASGAHRATALAFEFPVRTAGRSGQVRAARWDEVDETAATWTVPPARMKSKREHRVPLSRRAGGRPRRSAGAFRPQRFRVPFADRPHAQRQHALQLLRELGIGAVPHGFRSSFRDWAAAKTDVPREVCELALATSTATAWRPHTGATICSRSAGARGRLAAYVTATGT